MKIYNKMTKDNTALLVIDPVNSCASEKCETPEYGIHFSKVRQMLPRLNEFINQYRAKVGGPVFIANLNPWNKEHLPENLQELYTDPAACYYSDDKTGFDEQFFAVKPKETDIIITKNTYDAFSNPKLEKELKSRGIKYLATAGVFTDGCVLATIASGFSRGFNFIILKDLVETSDLPTRQELQKLLLEYTFPIMYGKTISSQDFLTSTQPRV